jgi:hypothetical protein
VACCKRRFSIQTTPNFLLYAASNNGLITARKKKTWWVITSGVHNFRCSSSKTNPVYGRRVNSFVLVLVFHHTDTSLYLLSLALALSIHNKLNLSLIVTSSLSLGVPVPTQCMPLYTRRVNSLLLVYSLSSHRHSYIPLIFDSHFIDS